MNENQVNNVKEYEFDKPLIRKIDSVINDCFRDCHNKYFHTFDHICCYDIKLTNITNNEKINITISDKNMSLYELKKINNCSRKWFYIYSNKSF